MHAACLLVRRVLPLGVGSNPTGPIPVNRGSASPAKRHRVKWDLVWMLAATLSLSGVGRARADVIVNGGFETGDFSGWTVNIDPLFTLVIP